MAPIADDKDGTEEPKLPKRGRGKKTARGLQVVALLRMTRAKDDSKREQAKMK